VRLAQSDGSEAAISGPEVGKLFCLTFLGRQNLNISHTTVINVKFASIHVPSRFSTADFRIIRDLL
jgi:hypothetical protein